MTRVESKRIIYIVYSILIVSQAESSEVEDDPDAKQMTVEKFVELVKVLEEAFPDVPPNEMVHKLRMLVSRYDSTVWKVRNTSASNFR